MFKSTFRLAFLLVLLLALKTAAAQDANEAYRIYAGLPRKTDSEYYQIHKFPP